MDGISPRYVQDRIAAASWSGDKELHRAARHAERARGLGLRTTA